MKLWKRNAIAAAIVLFVCGAVYLNWSYSQDTAAGKNLGEAALVGSQNDPLLEKQKEGAAAEEGAAGLHGKGYRGRSAVAVDRSAVALPGRRSDGEGTPVLRLH